MLLIDVTSGAVTQMPAPTNTFPIIPVWGPAGIATLDAATTPVEGSTAPDLAGYSETLFSPSGTLLRTLIPDASAPRPGSQFGFANSTGGAWSPDGRTLLLTTGPAHHSNGPLFTVPAGGGAPQPLGNIVAAAETSVSWAK
ncbi:MAG TPA: hypothetical protein VGI67_14035 [Thermoleophilaceae bacterium]